jgi:hypothetical protein
MVDDIRLGMLHPLHGEAATRADAHIKTVPQDVLHYLMRAMCFTPNTLAYLDQ